MSFNSLMLIGSMLRQWSTKQMPSRLLLKQVDEFYLKLFPMNLESKMAKKWFVLKAAEVVEKLTMRHKVATYEECSAQGA